MHPSVLAQLRAQGDTRVWTCPSRVGDVWARVSARSAGSAAGLRAFAGPSQTVTPAGTVKIAVIPVQFQQNGASSVITGSGQFQANNQGDTTSVHDSIAIMMSRADTYYRAVSYGRMQFSYTVFDTAMPTLSKTVNNYSGSNANLQELVRETLERADTAINYGAYDAVVILHAGWPSQLTGLDYVTGDGSGRDIPAQNFTLSNPISTFTEKAANGDTADTVTGAILMAAFGKVTNNEPVTLLGTFCHEFGHSLGLPDLYSTGTGTGGVGDWALMGTGNYAGKPEGDSPSWHDAWSREYFGWADTKPLDTDQTITSFKRAEEDSKIYKIKVSTSSEVEYFLLEEREPRNTGLDSSPGSGLLIWHIDNSKGSIYDNTVNNLSLVSRRRVDLVEADSSDVNVRASTYSVFSGTASMPWPGADGKTTLADNTRPSSRGYAQTSARFSIKNIAWTSDGASFKVSFTDTIGQYNTGAIVSFKAETTVLIPTVSEATDANFKRVSFKAADTDFSVSVGPGVASCTSVVQVEGRSDSVAVYVKTNSDTAVMDLLVPQANAFTLTSAPAGYPATEAGLTLFRKMVLDIRFVDASGAVLTDLSGGSQKYKYMIEYRLDSTLLNQLIAQGADTDSLKLWSASSINSSYSQISALTRISSNSASVHVYRSGELTTTSAKAVGLQGSSGSATFPSSCVLGRVLACCPRSASFVRAVRDRLLGTPAGRRIVSRYYGD